MRTLRLLGTALSLLMIIPFFQHCSPRVEEPNGGLILPDSFAAVVVVDSLPGKARHLAVSENGDVYVKANQMIKGGMNYVLRDEDKDGRADVIKNFGPDINEGAYATGMRIYKGYLYASSQTLVYRYKLTPGQMVPSGKEEYIVVDSGLLAREHNGKPLTFDDKGHIFVPFGAPSDACQENNREPNSPGRRPCPLLDSNGGVWMFDANRPNQFRMKDGVRVATGLRSLVAMTWNPNDSTLWCVQHGRDGLHAVWPQLYDPWQSAMLPSEAMFRLKPGTNAGWPYYYFDPMKRKVMLNPEYGGDGKIECQDSAISAPFYGFPAHWAPNDLLFYTGDQFPERYKRGAFIAFHGSTIRAPYPQSGYIIAFLPIIDGRPGKMEVFADGFTKMDTLVNTKDAQYRPMGLAQGPDGSLYISESEKGKIWKVSYKGDKKNFKEAQLIGMLASLNKTYVKDPDPVKDNLDRSKPLSAGESIYLAYCRACHQQDGRGDGTRFPPLAGSPWVTGSPDTLVNILLKGRETALEIDGKLYSGQMPNFFFLNDHDISEVLTYIRGKFGNAAAPIGEDLVRSWRDRNKAMKR